MSRLSSLFQRGRTPLLRRLSGVGAAGAVLALVSLASPLGDTLSAQAQSTRDNNAQATSSNKGSSKTGSDNNSENKDQKAALDLLAQTAFVTPDKTFDLVAQVKTSQDPNALDLVVTVAGAVRNRGEFHRSLEGSSSGSTQILQKRPLAEVITPERRIAVQLPINDSSQRSTYLARPGIYPIKIELREQGSSDSLAQLNTHIIKSAVGETRKFSVATAIPLNVASSKENPLDAPSSGSEYNEFASIAAAHRGLPLQVALSPEGFDRVSTLKTAPAETSVASLATAMTGRRGFAQTWASTPQSLSKDLSSEYERQLEAGISTSSRALGNSPQLETWLGLDALSQQGLTELESRGARHFVLRESNFVPIERATSITRPIKVRISRRNTVDAFQADEALTRHFETGGVLGAHRLLADLTTLYNDFPAQERGAIAMPPTDWSFDSALLNTYLDGLKTSPSLQATSLDSLFALSPELRGSATLTRDIAALDSADTFPVQDFENARKRLDGFGSMVDDDNPVLSSLSRQFFYSQSTRLFGRSRDEAFERYQKAFQGTLSQIRLPTERSIRLTASEGHIPVSIQNDTGHPIEVKLRVSSDQILFPEGREQLVNVERPQLTQRFHVESRTSGRFPVQITATSPDGTLQLARSQVNIISTSSSSVGMILTFGSLGFLILWWIVSLLQSRRSSRQEMKNSVS